MVKDNSNNPSKPTKKEEVVKNESKEAKDESSELKDESTKDADKSESIQKEKKSPVRLLTFLVLGFCFLFLIWYVQSNRYTPYSNQARLNALVIQIVPNVSGYLKESNVRLHSKVEENDVLFQIDTEEYQLAVQTALANIEKATQQMELEGAAIASAAGRLGVANAQLDRAQRNFDRVKTVIEDNPDALSQYDKDGAETALAMALEQAVSATADLEKAKKQLGEFGPDNATLKLAMVAHKNANLNLKYTTIKAPTSGVIESFNLDIGHYCAAGQPLATFISTRDVWIQADFPENSIGSIDVGDEVDFNLDIAPGKIFKGKVRSVGYGVSSDQWLNRGQLPDLKSKTGWLRAPQLFPVIIVFDDEEVMTYFKLGGQADVSVHNEDGHNILNAIAKFRIWINSKLSYVR